MPLSLVTKMDKTDLTSFSFLQFSPGSSADPYLNHLKETSFALHAPLTAYFLLTVCLAYSSTLKMDAAISSEMEVISKGLHGVIPQKKVLFTVTVMKTSNPKRTYMTSVCAVNKTITPTKRTFTSRLGFERVKEVT